LVEEVKKLLAMGYAAESKSMQSIGYRHMVEFIAERLPWEECVRTLKRDTRRFAKRQFTWFGADPQIKWYEPDQLNEIVKLVKGFLE
jgi:tRNA dimethylallyltransferase